MANINKITFDGNTLIDLSQDTVGTGTDKVLSGYTFHGSDGTKRTGSATALNGETRDVTLSTNPTTYTPSAGKNAITSIKVTAKSGSATGVAGTPTYKSHTQDSTNKKKFTITETVTAPAPTISAGWISSGAAGASSDRTISLTITDAQAQAAVGTAAFSNITTSTAANAVPLITTAGYTGTKKISELTVGSANTLSSIDNVGEISNIYCYGSSDIPEHIGKIGSLLVGWGAYIDTLNVDYYSNISDINLTHSASIGTISMSYDSVIDLIKASQGDGGVVINAIRSNSDIIEIGEINSHSSSSIGMAGAIELGSYSNIGDIYMDHASAMSDITLSGGSCTIGNISLEADPDGNSGISSISLTGFDDPSLGQYTAGIDSITLNSSNAYIGNISIANDSCYVNINGGNTDKGVKVTGHTAIVDGTTVTNSSGDLIMSVWGTGTAGTSLINTINPSTSEKYIKCGTSGWITAGKYFKIGAMPTGSATGNAGSLTYKSHGQDSTNKKKFVLTGTISAPAPTISTGYISSGTAGTSVDRTVTFTLTDAQAQAAVGTAVFSNVTTSIATNAVPLVTTAGYTDTKKISQISVPSGHSLDTINLDLNSSIGSLSASSSCSITNINLPASHISHMTVSGDPDAYGSIGDLNLTTYGTNNVYISSLTLTGVDDSTGTCDSHITNLTLNEVTHISNIIFNTACPDTYIDKIKLSDNEYTGLKINEILGGWDSYIGRINLNAMSTINSISVDSGSINSISIDGSPDSSGYIGDIHASGYGTNECCISSIWLDANQSDVYINNLNLNTVGYCHAYINNLYLISDDKGSYINNIYASSSGVNDSNESYIGKIDLEGSAYIDEITMRANQDYYDNDYANYIHNISTDGYLDLTLKPYVTFCNTSRNNNYNRFDGTIYLGGDSSNSPSCHIGDITMMGRNSATDRDVVEYITLGQGNYECDVNSIQMGKNSKLTSGSLYGQINTLTVASFTNASTTSQVNESLVYARGKTGFSVRNVWKYSNVDYIMLKCSAGSSIYSIRTTTGDGGSPSGGAYLSTSYTTSSTYTSRWCASGSYNKRIFLLKNVKNSSVTLYIAFGTDSSSISQQYTINIPAYELGVLTVQWNVPSANVPTGEAVVAVYSELKPNTSLVDQPLFHGRYS